MAAGLLRQRAGDRITVVSAGSEPAESLNPAVVAAMEEVGIDITGQVPTKLTDDMVRRVDVVVTMGCGDACPVYPGKRYVDWELEDPAGRPLEAVRTIRDDIRRRVEAPAMFLTGELDMVRSFMPAEAMRGWVTDLRAQIVVPGAGHWVQQQEPEAVNAALLAFLAGL